MVRQFAQQQSKDQASRLRDIVRGASRSAMTIAVTSGKGGVGKTNLAVNLAICLAAKGRRVTLVDLDMGLANADLLMNLRTRYTLSHVVSGQRAIDEIATQGPGGITFIPGASGLESFANMNEFERKNLATWLRALEASADIVLLDCGAGISRNVVTFAACADRTIVVTTPQPTALTDAYAMIKVVHREGFDGRLCLFVNMADSRVQAKGTYERISSVASRFLNFTIGDAGYMLYDKTVEAAVHSRCPFVIRFPNSAASACVAAVANELTRSGNAPRTRVSFFRRVAGLFA